MVRQRASDMRDSQAELARARHFQAVGRLASGLAHDFNNMLTIIASYASMANLRVARGQSPASEILEIETTVDRAAELTSQLLAFSRRDSGRPALIGLGSVIQSCEKLLRRLIGEHIDLEIETDEDLGTVRIDPVHAQQLVIHLVFNARDSLPDGGAVKVTARNATAAGKPVVELRVEDNGEALSSADLNRLIAGDWGDASSGPAIGLAAVRSILPAYHGKLSGESKSSKGSSFTVQLPRLDERRSDRTALADAAQAGGVVVLLVEDDERVRSVAKQMLSASGYQVFEASGAEGALELVASKKPAIDLLLTDVVMSGPSGTELASRLRQQIGHLKVLYMSGYDDEMLAHHSKDRVNGPLLQKPFSASELLGKIREALDTKVL
jgi:two-component system cell cycle sensor histidine kinase/response regulator CckA